MDRWGVANQGSTRSRPKQCPDAVAEPDGHVEPSRAVPTPDKVVAPLLFDRAVQGARRGSRHRAERIAVEIDEAVGNQETVAQTAKRICGIPSDARVPRNHGGRRHHESLAIKHQRTCRIMERALVPNSSLKASS